MDNKFEKIIFIENFVPMFLMLVGLIAFVILLYYSILNIILIRRTVRAEKENALFEYNKSISALMCVLLGLTFLFHFISFTNTSLLALNEQISERQFHRFFMSHSINVFLNFLLLSIGLFTHCGITFFRKSFELKNIKE